jgi:hypothetical protein
MDLKQAEVVIERHENGDPVYEQEYIDALEVVKEHYAKQSSYWKTEALSARTALKYSQMYSCTNLQDWKRGKIANLGIKRSAICKISDFIGNIQ